MNANRLLSAGFGLCFFASLWFWPRVPLAPLTLVSLLPHGLFAAWMIRRRGLGRLVWLPPLAWLAMLPFASPGWAVALAVSLYVLALALSLLGLSGGRDWLAGPAVLGRMIFAMVCYPALLVALALGLESLLFDVSLRFLPWLLNLWGAASLALLVVAPLGLCEPWNARRRYVELALFVLLACVLALPLVGNRSLSGFPDALLFLPVVLIAAFRCTVRGVSFVGLCALMLLTLFSYGAGPLSSVSEGLIMLCAVVAGLIVAAVVESQRRNEASLGEFQARIEALVNNSPNMMTFKGLDGRYILVNRAFTSHLGKSAAEMIGRRPNELFPIEYATQVRAQDDVVLRCLEPRQFEYAYALDGREYFLLVTKFPLFDAKGLPAGLGAVMTDISEQRKQQQAVLEAEEKYRALIEQSLAGIFIYQDGRWVYVNSKLAEMLGDTPEGLIGCTLHEMLAPGEQDRVEDIIRHRFDNNVQVVHYVTRVVRRDGSTMDVEVHSRLFEYKGRMASIGFALDISDRIAADASLKFAAKVFETSGEGILICDASRHIIAVNEAFSSITGYQRDEAVGHMSRVFSDESRPSFHDMMHALAEHGHWRGEMLDRRKGGDWYPAELSLSVVRDPHGDVAHYVGLFTDITVRKQAEERMHFLANHDPLTRLPNRSSLISSLEERLLSMAETGGQLAVIFIDLDRFKLINDSFGHQSGDELLRVIAIRLINSVGRRGMLARLGGDEFTLLVSDYAGTNGLSEIAEELLTVLSRPLRLEEHEVFVTGSIGISLYPNDGTDARTLLKNADVAMYRAKDSGKNTYQFFASEMNAQTVERLMLESGMRQALERNEFELHFQPQVRTGSRDLIGVEVLLRWRHPQLGLVSPGRFIPLAEETGLIKPIGNWVLAEACRQLTAWDREGIPVPRVAVNLSARQFEQQDLIAIVAGALERSGLAADRLELEITESMIMQNPVETVQILNELKRLGVQLAIDDFGTGYSSLSILKRFPLDSLKIDRSFIDGLPQDLDSAAITEAVLAMSRKLGFAVVAEGVEQEAQAQFLEGIGCDALQGYHFGKPMPAEHLAAWLGHGEEAFTPTVVPDGFLHSAQASG